MYRESIRLFAWHALWTTVTVWVFAAKGISAGFLLIGIQLLIVNQSPPIFFAMWLWNFRHRFRDTEQKRLIRELVSILRREHVQTILQCDAGMLMRAEEGRGALTQDKMRRLRFAGDYVRDLKDEGYLDASIREWLTTAPSKAALIPALSKRGGPMTPLEYIATEDAPYDLSFLMFQYISPPNR